MSVSKAMSLVAKICDALAYMHEKEIVHRDLKPANIMVCDDGSLRIMDFGIAKAAGMRRVTFTGFSPSMGTPDYMAPEQIKGKRGDQRTDIYSLGAILYEMVTGQVPFQGPNVYAVMNARLVGDPLAPRSLNPELSPHVEEIILHAMERDPAKRYPSSAEMKTDLDNPENVPITGRHQRLRRGTPWRRKFRRVRMYVITAMLPVIAFLLLWLILSRQGH